MEDVISTDQTNVIYDDHNNDEYKACVDNDEILTVEQKTIEDIILNTHHLQF